MSASNPRNETLSERSSDAELHVKRSFSGPAALVFKAWTTPELLLRWWAPKSFGITFVSCEADVRNGGSYRFVFSHPQAPEPMAFFGRYLEVVPPSLIKWTNEEGGPNGSITTATFTEANGVTTVEIRDVYPSKQALDDAIASGSAAGYDETFLQLDELLANL